MPELSRRARAGGRVRLWSAACSNGQEPYSMGMVVLSELPEANELDVKILATDIDPNMIAEGTAAGLGARECDYVVRSQVRRARKNPRVLQRRSEWSTEWETRW